MDKKQIESFYPLSPMQQGMFFHSLVAPDSGVYVEQMSCLLSGNLDTAAFTQAWQSAINRHAILRTGFVSEGLKEPVQVVHREIKAPMREEDWRHLLPEIQERRLEDYQQQIRRTGFVLEQPPLMRLALFRVKDNAWQFVWSHHHILLDGWSVMLLLKEVFQTYEALAQNRRVFLSPVQSFRDYIVWIYRQDPSTAAAFWKQSLKKFTAPTPLPVETAYEALSEEPHFLEKEIWLAPSLSAGLTGLARKYHITLNTLAMGAWALLLSRYSGEEDVVFGSVVSGRPADLPGAEEMIGLFINTLPMRVHVSAGTKACDYLQKIQARSAEMRQFEFSPLVQIQDWSDVPRSQPLFESILVFENYPIKEVLSNPEQALEVSQVSSMEQTNYPLNFIAGASDQVMLKLAYDSSRYCAETIQRMLGHLEAILSAIAVDPQRLLSSISILSTAEKEQILVEWNRTGRHFPAEACLQQLFEEQVSQDPDATALVYQGTRLTYRELDRRANCLAHCLQQAGVEVETLVAVLVERSPEMVIALLGILKAGGAYVPLDPAYTSERLEYTLQDSGAKLLLTQEKNLGCFSNFDGKTICLDRDWPDIAQNPDTPVLCPARATNLAYVIYTSGSTGKPKGTLLEHRGVCNFILENIRLMGIDSTDRFLQFASVGFDASVAEVFSALVSGAELHLLPREVLLSGSGLQRYLLDARITGAILPPSILSMLPVEQLSSLHIVGSAGEACPPDLAQRWAPGRRFFNAYGPTEASVGPTLYLVNENTSWTRNVPIGRPIANIQTYILDANLQPVPVGIPGELHLGGVGLARGYLNRPDLTKKKFIHNPFSPQDESRLYKTGDLARYLPDGNIEYLGRIDNQIKIRGFRIEPDEIEHALRAHPEVSEAAVIARETVNGEKKLLAYYVPNDGAPVPTSELRSFLSQRLPDYMIPATFIPMKVMPLSTSGKVDRKALPTAEQLAFQPEEEFVAPRTPLEKQLAAIWSEVLGVRQIGVHDGFLELGGHSLSAVRLLGLIEKQFGRSISIVSIFKGATLESMAAELSEEPLPPNEHSLVEMQPRGSKPPIFFVHPSGGSTHWYNDLARALGKDQPFYAFQAPGMNDGRIVHTSVPQMAAYYVNELVEFQPDGPYILGSWSMGVAIAFEMAQQLRAQGREPALLILLDQGPHLPERIPEDNAEYLIQVFGKQMSLSLDHLRTLDEDRQIAYVLEQGKKARFIFPDLNFANFRFFVSILRSHTQAWQDYQPQSYPGRVALIRAKKQSEKGDHSPDMGWAEYLTGEFEIYQVPGDHISMVYPPDVKALARRLASILDSLLVKA